MPNIEDAGDKERLSKNMGATCFFFNFDGPSEVLEPRLEGEMTSASTISTTDDFSVDKVAVPPDPTIF